MCGTCGCSDSEGGVLIRRPSEKHMHEHGHHTHNHDHTGHEHSHHGHEEHEEHLHEHGDQPNGISHHANDHGHHSHDHGHHGHEHHEHTHHSHDHDHGNSREIQLEQDILAHNNLLAERNRGFLEAKNITALNLVSSPGAGKTTLLEKTITTLREEMNFYVIEGDQQTMNDADRIEATGAPVIQINTGSGCHLDASMVNRAVKQLEPAAGSMLFIENVGNLVCPALFDLGETRRIVIISVTEGDDKPVKYPTIFRNTDVCIINKTDLLPYVEFDVSKTREYARQINPHIRFFELSATTGEGMEAWYEWLQSDITAR